MGPLDRRATLGFLTLRVDPYGNTNLSPPYSSLLANSSFVSRYFLVYLPGLFSPSALLFAPFAALKIKNIHVINVFIGYLITYLTSSSFKHPFPIKASFGCKYLWNVFLITESLLTLIPTCSSIALMLVFCLCSPPSAIIIIHRPPSSMYRLISYSS